MDRNPIKIVIADDNRFFCSALKDSLNQHEDLFVLDTFTNLNDLIHFTNHQNLDVLILDINFKGVSSLDFFSKIKPLDATFKVIALTTMNNNFIKDNAYLTGVDAFVGKDENLNNFKEVIFNCYFQNTKQVEKTSSKIIVDNYVFTKRKLEVLQALYDHSDKIEKTLSEVLNISESALKSHKRELFEISNTKNTVELIKFGIQNNLIIT